MTIQLLSNNANYVVSQAAKNALAAKRAPTTFTAAVEGRSL